jgi:type IV pilus assembly protein PilA
MALITCPKCGRQLDTAGAKPGTPLTCQCGNVLRAPSSNKTTWLIGIGLGLFGLCGCLGVLAAIAVPNFLKFQARAKQAECKANLKTAFTAQQGYFAENEAYTESLAELNWMPERGNRYAYFFGTEGEVQERTAEAPPVANPVGVGVDLAKFGASAAIPNDPDLVGIPYGVTGTCPQCEITLVCVGNVDNDSTLDAWVISSAELTDPHGRPIPVGQPFQLTDDVND